MPLPLKLSIPRSQFNAAARKRNFTQPALKAAKLVMCEGLTYREAGELNDLSTQRVYTVVRELRREVDAL